MQVLTTKENLIRQVEACLRQNKTIGLVPTMGALHQGHAALVRRSVAENDVCVVSVFVNPTQFNNKEDLQKYPRTLEKDVELLTQLGVHFVFAPSPEEMYSAEEMNTQFSFDFNGLDKVMEGKMRPGHFNGVVQVVSRLFELVRPTRAYFGEKDFQQIAVIRAMMRQLGIGLELIPCPIVRGEDGLALSSRNTLLTPEHRAAAPDIYAALRLGAEAVGTKTPAEVVSIIEQAIEKSGLLKVIYVEVVDGDSLESIAEWKSAASGRVQCCVAVQAGAIRLIDNIKLV